MIETKLKNRNVVKTDITKLPWTKRLFFSLALAFLALFMVELIGQFLYFAVVGDWLKNRTLLPIYQKPGARGEVYELRRNLNIQYRTQEYIMKIVTNSQGFRTSEPELVFPAAKSENEYRILLFGPSFTFGSAVNYDETWGKLLGDLLQKNTAKKITVINAGIPSLGNYHALRRAQHLVPEYHPDLIIFIKYFPGLPKFPPEMLEVTDDGYLVHQGQQWLSYLKKSAIVYWAFQFKYLLGKGHAHEQQFAADEGNTKNWTDSPLYSQWQTKFLDEFERLAKNNGAKLLVAYAPAQFEVYEEYLARWYHRKDYDGKMFNHLKTFHTFMGDALKGREIYYVDLLPVLRDAASANPETKLYYYLDVHWTPEGNRVVAESLSTIVQRAGLLR
ncbi:hypothetical protein L0337_13450 [candidate division KSB1 bacterium]|nr:hypothetical protein [candidate division KSB1 bacterium]